MASSAEPETRLCGNCKRDIPVDNFTIHEVHCRRNINMCKLCDEAIPRSNMDDHYAREHAAVTCKCAMTMEKRALEEHEKSSCPLRLVKCQFCELEVTFNTLGNHEDYCGARTELCERCGSSVMVKDLKDHPTLCGQVKQQKRTQRVQSWADRDYEVPLRSALNSRSAFMDSLYSQMPRRVPERFSGKSILTHSLKKFDDVNQNASREKNRGRERTNLGLDMDSPLGFLDPRLEERLKTFHNYDYLCSQSHQDNAQSGSESRSPFTENNDDFWRDYYCKDNKMKINVCGRSNMNYFPSNESAHLNPRSTLADDATQLPCEFCEELFPEQDLILHQSGCRPDVSSSVRRSPSPPLDFTENLRSSSPPAPNPQSVIIPCEFCGVLMEGDILFHHQDQCDMGPNADKTPELAAPSIANDVSPAEDGYKSYRVPTAPHLHGQRTAPGSNAAVSSRMQAMENADNTTRDHNRFDGLYRQLNNTRQSSLEKMRKKNMDENARMVKKQYEDFFGNTRGASSRDTGARSQPKKKINTRPEEVDKEE